MEGNAIVYCEGAFNTTNGKTAHGLVRFSERYKVIAVIDSQYAGRDALDVLDGRNAGIPVVSSLVEAIGVGKGKGNYPTHLVIGIAPDGGRLQGNTWKDIKYALEHKLNIVSGLHDFVSDDEIFRDIARENGLTIRDVRKPPMRKYLHFFSGKIEKVECLKLAVLGTDSAVGKRTTAWRIVHGLRQKGYKTELIGTGQTSWMQGAHYSVIMDSLVNDFVSGEIEHAIYSAWTEQRPDVIVIEGQGSLMNPAYPGGYEILAAGRPDFVILQHAPKRLEYDGFPGYKIHPLEKQIEAIELISGKKVLAITVNHEKMEMAEIPAVCSSILKETGLPAFDVLVNGPDELVQMLLPHIKQMPIPLVS